MASRKLIIEVIGDDRSLHRALGRASNETRGFGSTLARVGKTAGLVAGGAALGGLAVVLRAGIPEWKESTLVAAQTRAVLKSTGGVAGVTAKHVDKLAATILNYSGIDDEATKASENLLLGFTNVRNEVGKGNDIFDRAIKVITDYSVRTGKDASAATQLFGKTLNEIAQGQIPTSIRGIGKLSKEMQKEIKAHLKAGDVAAAQAVVLKELEKRFGGAAKAAGGTLPGKLNILRENFKNVSAELVAKLIPALTKVVTWVSDHWPQITATFQAVTRGIGVAIDSAIRVIRPMVEFIRQHWPEISEKVREVAAVVTSVFNAVWPTASKIVKIAVDAILPLIKSIATIVKGMVEIVSGLLHGDFSRVWSGIKDVVGGAVNAVKTILSTSAKIMFTLAKQLGLAIFHGLESALVGIAAMVARLLIAPINAAIDLINRVPFVSIPKIPVPGQGAGGKTVPVPGPQGPSATGRAPRVRISPPVTGLQGPQGGRANTAAVHINGPITVVANDPDAFLRELQKKASRQSGSRAGPQGGINLGLA